MVLLRNMTNIPTIKKITPIVICQPCFTAGQMTHIEARAKTAPMRCVQVFPFSPLHMFFLRSYRFTPKLSLHSEVNGLSALEVKEANIMAFLPQTTMRANVILVANIQKTEMPVMAITMVSSSME